MWNEGHPPHSAKRVANGERGISFTLSVFNAFPERNDSEGRARNFVGLMKLKFKLSISMIEMMEQSEWAAGEESKSSLWIPPTQFARSWIFDQNVPLKEDEYEFFNEKQSWINFYLFIEFIVFFSFKSKILYSIHTSATNIIICITFLVIKTWINFEEKELCRPNEHANLETISSNLDFCMTY